jgi:hypothetical protein
VSSSTKRIPAKSARFTRRCIFHESAPNFGAEVLIFDALVAPKLPIFTKREKPELTLRAYKI